MLTTVYIPDVHNNPDALQLSLQHADCFTDGACKSIRDDIQVVLLGDLFDYGSRHKETVDKVRALLKEMGDRCIYLCGNHEIMLWKAVLGNSPHYINSWLTRGGMQNLIELAREKNFFRSDAADIPKMIGNFKDKNEYDRWKHAIKQLNASDIDFEVAWSCYQQHMLESENRILRDSMQIAHAANNILAVHAYPHVGCNGNIQQYNQYFRTQMRGTLEQYPSDSSFVHTLWERMDGASEIDTHDIHMLHKNDIGLVIVGHDIHLQNPRMTEAEEVHVLHLDVGMTYHPSSPFCYAKHTPSGEVRVASFLSGSEERTLGRFTDGKFCKEE